MRKLVNLLLIFFIATPLFAQEESADVRAGNKLYKSEKYTDAEVAYRKGLQKNSKSFEANYNLGNALFKQGKHAEALEQYKIAQALVGKDKSKIASTLHNAGNSLLSEKKIQESIEAYKMALKANPKDNETRYNLAYAQTLLQQQQNQNQNQDQKQEKEEEKPQEEQQQNQPPPQPKQNEMSKDNAEQILEALQQDEKNTLEKVKRQDAKSKKSLEKDW